MNQSISNTQTIFLDHEKRKEIDASCRIPVLAFFGSAIFWLLIGTLFALVASIKLHHVEFISEYAAATFGRVRMAHLNTVIFGWAAPAGVGTAIWLTARLCRRPLRNGWIVLTAALLWNIGILVGIVAILAGEGTSIEWLEFPSYVAFILFISFAFIAIWIIDMFLNREPGHVYVSQWYILAALFWFPWLYSTVQLMLILKPVQGSVQSIIHWWFAHNVLGLWFTPLGLAAAYYMIPKVIGRPIHSYYLSILGFWSLALFYSWNGSHHLIGGPLPAWIISIGVISSVMMIIPVVTVAINHHMTMKGHFHRLKDSPTLRFVVFGAMAYTVTSLQGVSMAVRWWNQLTHFTHHTVGHAHLGMYAFFTMVMFGCMYYIVPRLTDWEWPSARLIRIHFWTTASGVTIMFLATSIGGLLQGLALENPSIPFSAVTNYTIPFLLARSGSGILIAIGHIAFAISFVMMLLQYGAKRTEPTLFTNEPSSPLNLATERSTEVDHP